jgi:hypothetical protein
VTCLACARVAWTAQVPGPSTSPLDAAEMAWSGGLVLRLTWLPWDMTNTKVYVGGCLCGAVRYEARGDPTHEGYCFCRDCRKASGSGFVPFLFFPASSVRISGETRRSIVNSLRGGEAVRNHCATCGGLVFGGIIGKDTAHTIYAGSLDEPALFRPRIALFLRDKPDWVPLPAGLTVFETMPEQ